MTKDWALQNSGFLSVVFTLKEDTYSSIAKLLEQNGIEFMSHKASFAQQTVTSTLETSSVGKISDRHKTETWKVEGKVKDDDTAESYLDQTVAGKEYLMKSKNPKSRIVVSDSKADLSTSSPLFQGTENIPAATLMDMIGAPIEVSLNGSAETEIISVLTAGQKVQEKVLEPEIIVSVKTDLKENAIPETKNSKKPWMEKKVDKRIGLYFLII